MSPPPGTPVTVAGLVERVAARVPEAADVLAEHADDHDGAVLVHVLLPDLLRSTVECFHDGRPAVSTRLLEVLASWPAGPAGQLARDRRRRAGPR